MLNNGFGKMKKCTEFSYSFWVKNQENQGKRAIFAIS